MSRSCEGIAIGPTIGVDIRVGKMTESRPVRARGLKQAVVVVHVAGVRVAPRAGAWIETAPSRPGRRLRQVAPRAGAWIETGPAEGLRHDNVSRAPCGRVD